MNEIITNLKNACTKNASHVACIDEAKHITYKEFWEQINYYGNLLKEETKPVIIYGDNSINSLIAIFSLIIANRTYVPIGSCMPLERIKEIVEMLSCDLIISNQRIDIEGTKCLNLPELSTYSNYKNKINNNETAYIIFTSGSTGKPKGVPISYNNLNNFIKWISNFEVLNAYKDINVMNTASFSFDLSIADIFYSLMNGHTLCILQNKESLNNIFDFMLKKHINLIVATPTLIKMFLLDETFNMNTFKDLKCIYFCGERLDVIVSQKLLNRFPKLKIINGYGPTETTSAVSAIVINESMLSKDILPIGKINTCASSISIENDEIIIKGKSVFDGYLNINSDKIYKENNINVFKTGDLGYIENDYIYIKGRNDNQIKYKGYRIELDDVELNLLKINQVTNAAVIPIYNEKGIVKSLKAFITSKSDINAEDIKIELSKMIPKYMIPKIKILTSLPVNKNGKIDRKGLMNL